MVDAPEPILLNDFRRAWAEVGGGVLEATAKVGSSGWYILGEEVRRFEAALAILWGFDHAVGVGNGLDALEIGLRCLGIRAGDRVLTTPVSAFASSLAILRVGAIPVFVDVDERGLLDLDAAEERLRRGDVRGLLPVHLCGHVVDLDRLEDLAQRHGVLLLEDCAQSIGATWKGRSTGSAGAVAATSFYPTKNLGAMGDGGALLCRDPEHAARARRLRSYGEGARYDHVEIGLNSRLDELQAAILGDVMLPRLASWTGRRAAIAERYCSSIPSRRIEIPVSAPDSQPVWHLFPVLVEPHRRESFRAHCGARGIATGIHYPIAIPDQRAVAGLELEEVNELPRARRWCASEVSLPIHPWLDAEEIDRVIEACAAWPG